MALMSPREPLLVKKSFLDQERRRYAAQLENYVRAIQGARAGLYFPLMRGWRPSED